MPFWYIYKSFKGEQSAEVKQVSYSITTSGYHWIYVKFRKDTSQHKENDSVKFKFSSNSLHSVDPNPTKFTPNEPFELVQPIYTGYENAYLEDENGDVITQTPSVAGDITLYGVHDDFVSYTISGSDLSSSKTYYYSSTQQTITLPTPTKAARAFTIFSAPASCSPS